MTKRQKRAIWGSLGILIFIFLYFSVSRLYYKIPAASMENALMAGDRLLVDPFAYWFGEPERMDIAVFYHPRDLKTKYIKRIVGLPGDTIEIREKILYVNGLRSSDARTVKHIDTTASGEQVIQPRRPGGMDSRDNFGPFVIPPDSYFMMGDNRDNSFDSRWWGAVNRRLLVGKVGMIFNGR